MSSPSRSGRTKAVLVVAGLLAGLVLAELGLDAARVVWRWHRDRTGVQVHSDPKYRVRLEPGHGTDAWGFNNDRVPDRADVVAIGDSLTWGVNAEREQAWPQALAKASGLGVFNLSVSSYGPLEYLALLPKAFELKPRAVIVGLYLGNDLRNAYSAVYCRKAYPARVRPGVPECGLGATLEEALAAETRFVQAYRDQPVRRQLLWAGEHLVFFRLLAKADLWPRASLESFALARRWAAADPAHAVAYERGGVRTIFSPALTLGQIDLEDPRIAEGLRITEEALAEMETETRAHGVPLLVLLIPTKESAFAAAGVANAGFDRAVAMETRVREALVQSFAARGIRWVDALPALSAAVARGEAIAPPHRDIHFMPPGYAVIAETARAAVGELLASGSRDLSPRAPPSPASAGVSR